MDGREGKCLQMEAWGIQGRLGSRNFGILADVIYLRPFQLIEEGFRGIS